MDLSIVPVDNLPKKKKEYKDWKIHEIQDILTRQRLLSAWYGL